MDPNQKRQMPDVATTESSNHLSELEWVGMEKIAIPVVLADTSRTLAEADIFVNLAQKDAKGIHMSRAYLALHEGLEMKALTGKAIAALLKSFVDSQKGLSTAAKLVLRWNELHSRPALLSDNKGWKEYPVELTAQLNQDQLSVDLKFSIFYSSTCPCSAALSRQLYQQAFAKEFCEDNLSFKKVFDWLGESKIAAPHSQRSRADIEVRLNDNVEDLSVIEYINKVEAALKTPVQSAVKREDEQEFARLNGENTMFVEDALRTIKNALSDCEQLQKFVVKTHHFESLHAHDAVGSIKS